MRRSAWSGVLFGLFVIVFGVLALANSLFHINLHVTFTEFWALVIMALAVVSFVHSGIHFWNVIFFVIGLWLFLKDIPFFFGRIGFPVLIASLIILLGLWIMISSFVHPHGNTGSAGAQNTNYDNSDYVEYNYVFSDNTAFNSSKSFKGGHASSVFGRAVIDLSQIQLQSTAVLEVSAVFGTLEVKLPANIPCRTDVTPVFGSFLNRAPTAPAYEGAPVLIIKGAAVFGTCTLV